MKSIFIAFDQAYYDKIVTMLVLCHTETAVLVMVLLSEIIYHDSGNSYNRKHLIKASYS